MSYANIPTQTTTIVSNQSVAINTIAALSAYGITTTVITRTYIAGMGGILVDQTSSKCRTNTTIWVVTDSTTVASAASTHDSSPASSLIITRVCSYRSLLPDFLRLL